MTLLPTISRMSPFFRQRNFIKPRAFMVGKRSNSFFKGYKRTPIQDAIGRKESSPQGSVTRPFELNQAEASSSARGTPLNIVISDVQTLSSVGKQPSPLTSNPCSNIFVPLNVPQVHSENKLPFPVKMEQKGARDQGVSFFDRGSSRELCPISPSPPDLTPIITPPRNPTQNNSKTLLPSPFAVTCFGERVVSQYTSACLDGQEEKTFSFIPSSGSSFNQKRVNPLNSLDAHSTKGTHTLRMMLEEAKEGKGTKSEKKSTKKLIDCVMREIMVHFRMSRNGEKIVPIHLTELNSKLSDVALEFLATKGGLLRFLKDRNPFFRIKKMIKQGGYYVTTHVHVCERFGGLLDRMPGK